MVGTANFRSDGEILRKKNKKIKTVRSQSKALSKSSGASKTSKAKTVAKKAVQLGSYFFGGLKLIPLFDRSNDPLDTSRFDNIALS